LPHPIIGGQDAGVGNDFLWHKLDPLLGDAFRGRQPRQFGTFLTHSGHSDRAAALNTMIIPTNGDYLLAPIGVSFSERSGGSKNLALRIGIE
jgi:hypothetical protein